MDHLRWDFKLANIRSRAGSTCAGRATKPPDAVSQLPCFRSLPGRPAPLPIPAGNLREMAGLCLRVQDSRGAPVLPSGAECGRGQRHVAPRARGGSGAGAAVPALRSGLRGPAAGGGSRGHSSPGPSRVGALHPRLQLCSGGRRRRSGRAGAGGFPPLFSPLSLLPFIPSLPSVLPSCPPRRARPEAAPLAALHGGAGGRAAAGPGLRVAAAAAAGAAGELGGLPGAAGARRRNPSGRHRARRRAALRARELPAGRAPRGLRALPLPRLLPRRNPLRLQVWHKLSAAAAPRGLLGRCEGESRGARGAVPHQGVFFFLDVQRLWRWVGAAAEVRFRSRCSCQRCPVGAFGVSSWKQAGWAVSYMRDIQITMGRYL